MKITIEKDLRCLKAGSSFSFKEGELNVVLGKNGCGKTTLLNAVRGYFEEPSTNDYDLNAEDRKILSRSISVEGGEDTHWFSASKEDDPMNAIDAYTFVTQGGLDLRGMSQGQKFFKMFQQTCTSAMIAAKSGLKVGIIFDEVDSHFDCYTQVKFITILSRIAIKYDITVLMTTHHFGVILGCKNCLILEDSEFIAEMDGSDYFAKLQDQAFKNM